MDRRPRCSNSPETRPRTAAIDPGSSYASFARFRAFSRRIAKDFATAENSIVLYSFGTRPRHSRLGSSRAVYATIQVAMPTLASTLFCTTPTTRVSPDASPGTVHDRQPEVANRRGTIAFSAPRVAISHSRGGSPRQPPSRHQPSGHLVIRRRHRVHRSALRLPRSTLRIAAAQVGIESSDSSGRFTPLRTNRTPRSLPKRKFFRSSRFPQHRCAPQPSVTLFEARFVRPGVPNKSLE